MEGHRITLVKTDLGTSSGVAARCECGEWATRVNQPPSRGGTSRAIRQHKQHLEKVEAKS